MLSARSGVAGFSMNDSMESNSGAFLTEMRETAYVLAVGACRSVWVRAGLERRLLVAERYGKEPSAGRRVGPR